MPAGAKISIASMKADPMMPKMSVTSLATKVSTKASEGVIFCTPVATVRTGVDAFFAMNSPPAKAPQGKPRPRFVPNLSQMPRNIRTFFLNYWIVMFRKMKCV